MLFSLKNESSSPQFNPTEIRLRGIVAIVGNYGSGKTEVALNLAMFTRRSGLTVRIADLDIVNPYFRTREARQHLMELGIDPVLPAEKYLQADLPILSPEISGMFSDPAQLALLDCGGDGVGAQVLATLPGLFKGKPFQLLQVINPFRPFTDSHQGCLTLKERIETASKLTISGIIGNANLMDETTPADIYYGYDFINELSQKTGLPLVCVTSLRELLPELKTGRFACPVLPIDRQLVFPWSVQNSQPGS